MWVGLDEWVLLHNVCEFKGPSTQIIQLCCPKVSLILYFVKIRQSSKFINGLHGVVAVPIFFDCLFPPTHACHWTKPTRKSAVYGSVLDKLDTRGPAEAWRAIWGIGRGDE